MPVWAQAGWWGLLAGGALVVGALVAWFVSVPRQVVAGIMAFGAGVLISALAFDLVDKAERSGGLGATVGGFIGGAKRRFGCHGRRLHRRGVPGRNSRGLVQQARLREDHLS